MKQEVNKMFIVAVMTIGMIVIGFSSGFAQDSISSSLGVIPYPAKG